MRPTFESETPGQKLMHLLKIDILRFVDAGQPGWVECALIDAWGRKWTFIEKVPVLSNELLDENSTYPRPSSIACTVRHQWLDADKHEVLSVDTREPWGIEATDGTHLFDVRPGQVERS